MANGASFLQTLLALNALPGGDRPPILSPLGPIAPPVTTELPRTPPIGLMQTFDPSPPPIAPDQPIDRSIIDRFLQIAGPAPTPPVIQPAGRLEQIATALLGVQAGLQGNAPQFVESVRERRARPQREFEQRRQQFEDTRRQIGLIGTQAAMSDAERRQARQQAIADRRFEMEVDQRARQLRIEDEAQKEELRDLLLRRRQTEDDQRAQEEAQRKEARQQELGARKIERDFIAAGAPGGVAHNLGRFYSGATTERSQTAARWEERAAQAELQRKRHGRGTGGGVSTSRLPIGRINPNTELGRAAAVARINEFELAKQELSAAIGGGNEARQRFARRNLERVITELSKRPDVFEIGSGGPDIDRSFVKLVQPGGNVGFPLQPQAGQAAQPQGTPQTFNLNEPDAATVREYAQRFGLSEEQARRELQGGN